MKEQEVPAGDHMRRNMDSIRFFMLDRDDRLTQLRNLAHYRSAAQAQRKHELQYDKQRLNMFLVQKWDILKEKKQEMLGEAKARQR